MRHKEAPMKRNAVLPGLLALSLFALPALAQQDWCYDSDLVYARVEESTVVLIHEGAFYNCCPETFDFEISVEEQLIRVTEIEILENPCFCLCCYNLALEIEDVAPGDYTIEFTWFDYESNGWVIEVLEVSVGDFGQPGEIVVGNVQASDCIAAASVPEEEQEEEAADPDSWGAIKNEFQ
jgi:hypothetical protein